jgi:hypothetical protein
VALGGRGYCATKAAMHSPPSYSVTTCRVSLELRVERLREFDLSSMLRPATTIDMMLTNLRTPTFIAEATSVASDMPCRHSFDPKRRPGYVLALAGSYAR